MYEPNSVCVHGQTQRGHKPECRVVEVEFRQTVSSASH